MATKKPGRGVDRKGRSKKGGKFVRLGEGLLTSEAWRSLSGSAVRFYVELRRRFNGRNNGELHLTAEEAKTTLRMGTNTFVRVQRELQEKGFIRMTRQGGFHQRLPTLWALTDEAVGTRPPSHAYKLWTPEKPNIIAETATTSLPKRQRGMRANGSFVAETRTIEGDSEPPFIAGTATILDIYQGGGG